MKTNTLSKRNNESSDNKNVLKSGSLRLKTRQLKNTGAFKAVAGGGASYGSYGSYGTPHTASGPTASV